VSEQRKSGLRGNQELGGHKRRVGESRKKDGKHAQDGAKESFCKAFKKGGKKKTRISISKCSAGRYLE